MFSMQIVKIIAFSTCLHSVLAYPQPSSTTSTPVPYSTIYQFNQTGAWVENIAVRSNGNLLVSRLDVPELWEIPPFALSKASLIHHFSNVDGLFGISEYAPDVFGVITGNFTLTSASTPGTYSVWTADFNHAPKVAISKITDIPEGGLLNGLTTFSTHPPTLLASDSTAGEVYKVDVRSREYSVVLKDASMNAIAGSSVSIGINGVRYAKPYLYYTNFDEGTLNRVRLSDDATAAGPYTVIAHNTTFADDFALADDGTAYVCGNSVNTLYRVSRGGGVEVVLGGVNETTVSAPTSAQFGRTRKDKGTLYVVGGAGEVLAVDVGRK